MRRGPSALDCLARKWERSEVGQEWYKGARESTTQELKEALINGEVHLCWTWVL